MTTTVAAPQLFTKAPNAQEAAEFYKAAFGAQEVKRCLLPHKKAHLPPVFCSVLKIGSSVIVVCDQADDSEPPLGGNYSFCLETEDLEAAVAKAVAAGATPVGEITRDVGVCCGARAMKLKDPYGNVWAFCNSITQCC